MQRHINGIDWLRAIFSVCVVLWHLGGTGRSPLFDSGYPTHAFTLSDFGNFHILLLAVPSFILISCFLHVRKHPDRSDLTRQLGRLALLAIFWTVVFRIWFGGHRGLLKLVPHSVSDAVLLVIRSGDTFYYFFVSLAVATLLAFVASRASTARNVVFFAATSALLFALPAITLWLRWFPLSAYWSPLNFLPYPFAAVLLYRACGSLQSKPVALAACAVALAVCACAFAWYEWTFDKNGFFYMFQGYALPAYTRLSLVFTSALLLLLMLALPVPSHPLVRFMSRHSLALYCIHPLYLGMVSGAVGRDVLPAPAARGAELLVMLGMCYLTSLALAPFLKRYLIRVGSERAAGAILRVRMKTSRPIPDGPRGGGQHVPFGGEGKESNLPSRERETARF